ncbi:MAG: thioredoxin family protein [Bacteroidia bacterium]|nr:thioredoxin family protein [Bacteroidia bacterium]
MKRFLYLAFLVIVSANCFPQVLHPVKWSFSVNRVSDNEAELVFKAVIEKKWHLYSQFVPPGGPLPTVFKYEKSGKFKKTGTVSEFPKPKEEYDATFEMNVKSFVNKATFKQKIRLLTGKPFEIKGSIEYMCCDDQRCIPLQEDFSFKIDSGLLLNRADSLTGNNTDTVLLTSDSSKTLIANKDSATSIIKNKSDQTTSSDTNTSLWIFFLISFLGGLAGVITPCVFPMIPMTVSFFMKNTDKRSKAKKQALFYGFSIIVIYTGFGLIISALLGPDFANWLSTHWLPNILFFLLFLIFALSFFGMFEIILPNWLISKSDKHADKGGYFGIFFMAFTLVLVSFSCTAPIVGGLLVEAARGEVLKPTIGMFGFSLAFALPFTLLAFFPSWLKKLPKSGGWLNSIKVVLGFLILALGMKFLIVPDQTYHWGLLSRELYLAFWMVIFTLMGFYLLGKIKFSHDSDLPYISITRLILTIFTFAFVIYLIPGLFGAPLKAISGLLPPQTSESFYFNKTSIPENVSSKESNFKLCEKPKYADFLHLPNGLEGYFDYEQGLACAKKLNKPVFISFTGLACAKCRDMEANVWSDPKVLQRLREKYIVIALYVDDKTDLPESEWITSKLDGKVKKTIGKKYADYQIARFNVNAQPYYVLLDHNGDLLTTPRAYNKSVDEFISFLDKGVEEFNKRQGSAKNN